MERPTEKAERAWATRLRTEAGTAPIARSAPKWLQSTSVAIASRDAIGLRRMRASCKPWLSPAAGYSCSRDSP